MKKIYKIKVNNKVYEVELEEVCEANGSIDTPKESIKTEEIASGDAVTVTAPMPGSVFDIKVNIGSKVTKGQVVAVLEAMKMETEILSPESGTISSISKNKGESVVLGDVILTIN